jgi:putative ABC transport system permease protein
LVWRLTWRSRLKLYPFCLLLTIIAVLLAGVTLTSVGLESAIATGSARFGADLMVLPAGAEAPVNAALIGGLPLKRLLPAGVEQRLASLAGVGLIAPQYFLSSATASCCETGNLLLIGFDWDRDFTVTPWLAQKLPVFRERDDLLIGGGVMKVKGAEFRLYNRTFRVAARLEKSGIGYFDNAVFIPLAGIAAMEGATNGGPLKLFVPWGRPALLLIRLAPGADPAKMATSMEQSVPGIRVVAIPELFRRERARLAQMEAAGMPLLLAGWLVALLAGGAIQFLYWRSHRRTLGLLRVWGYGRSMLALLFAAEIFLVALLAMIGGSLAVFSGLQYYAGDLAQTLGLPLLLDAGSGVSAGIPWLCLAFAGGMAGETLLIIASLLRHDPVALLGRA